MLVNKINYKRGLIKKGLMQFELADLIGVTPEYLSKVINGKLEVSLTIAIKISDALDVNIDDLFEKDIIKEKV